MNIKDQYNDPAYATLYTILQDNQEVADFVKTSSLDEKMAEELPDSVFAWPEKRRFPINTPENTVLSKLYRDKCASVPVNVDKLLNNAVEVYGVNHLVEQKKEASYIEEVNDSDYLLPDLKRLRVKVAADLKLAEKTLNEQYQRLNVEDRATGFTNLAKKAEELGVELKPQTKRLAGLTECDCKYAHDYIEARNCATDNETLQNAYTKLASVFSVQKNHPREQLLKVVDTLAELDKKAGVEHLYDKKLPDPIQTIFNTTKVAEEMLDIAGREVPVSALSSLPMTFWEDVMGPEMTTEINDGKGGVDIEKLKQVVPTLPLDLKLILKNQIP